MNKFAIYIYNIRFSFDIKMFLPKKMLRRRNQEVARKSCDG